MKKFRPEVSQRGSIFDRLVWALYADIYVDSIDVGRFWVLIYLENYWWMGFVDIMIRLNLNKITLRVNKHLVCLSELGHKVCLDKP